MEEDDKRILKDRRKHPTLGLSLYTFLGRRRKFRRKTDQERGGYTDHYSAGLFFVLILIVGLNILDSLFTMIILDHGGCEVNPIVRCVIELYGDRFCVWKFFLVSFSLIFICLHSNFGRVRALINCVALIYIAVVLYQMFLITYQLPEIP